MEEILKVENISKKYPSFSLKNINFSLNKGRIVGFIGRNGAGKTTTLKCIYGLVSPSSGEVYFEGNKIEDHEGEIKNEIGLLFGGIDYFPTKKLKTLTSVSSRFYASWDQEQYEKLMKYFNLDENKKLKELSNGMRVKYGLTMALSHHAKVLLLDESTSGLEPVSRDEILDIFLKIVKRNETSILFSTHVISDLEKCADDIVYIKDGG